MTDFRRDFEARLPAINAAIDAMPGSLEAALPGMSKPKLKRFFQRFVLLLGRLDKNGARQPQYLFYAGQLIPPYLVAVTDQATNFMASGASTFVQNSMTPLVELQDRLERAVGTDVDQLKSMASTVAADLGVSAQQAEELLGSMRQQSHHVDELQDQVIAKRKSAEELLGKIETAAAKSEDIQRSLEQLVSPDARHKNSLEAQARRARERVSEIDELHDKVTRLFEEATTFTQSAAGSRDSAEQELVGLRDLRAEAEQVLNLSSQAGLAASYKLESQRLDKRSNLFTGALYSASILTAVLAAFWVIPGLQETIKAEGATSMSHALALALLRISVLAPLVYLIIFTSKRISSLETLRMDYAEKAAASLAYSGYREQMTNDDDLLRQLKGSLLIKFAEHPERLLRSSLTTTSARVKTPGFEAETTVNATPAKEAPRVATDEAEAG